MLSTSSSGTWSGCWTNGVLVVVLEAAPRLLAPTTQQLHHGSVAHQRNLGFVLPSLRKPFNPSLRTVAINAYLQLQITFILAAHESGCIAQLISSTSAGTPSRTCKPLNIQEPRCSPERQRDFPYPNIHHRGHHSSVVQRAPRRLCRTAQAHHARCPRPL